MPKSICECKTVLSHIFAIEFPVVHPLVINYENYAGNFTLAAKNLFQLIIMNFVMKEEVRKEYKGWEGHF